MIAHTTVSHVLLMISVLSVRWTNSRISTDCLALLVLIPFDLLPNCLKPTEVNNSPLNGPFKDVEYGIFFNILYSFAQLPSLCCIFI